MHPGPFHPRQSPPPHPNRPRHTPLPCLLRRTRHGVCKRTGTLAGEGAGAPEGVDPGAPAFFVQHLRTWGSLQHKPPGEALRFCCPLLLLFFRTLNLGPQISWRRDVWGMPYRIQQVGKLNRGWTARVLEVFFFFAAPKSRWRFRVEWGIIRPCVRVRLFRLWVPLLEV